MKFYIKIKGRWHYLFRAIDADGLTLDIWLRKKRRAEDNSYKLEDTAYQEDKARKAETEDKLAIEAGKLLVEEILHNTIDNTNLIDKCEKGGKINGSI